MNRNLTGTEDSFTTEFAEQYSGDYEQQRLPSRERANTIDRDARRPDSRPDTNMNRTDWGDGSDFDNSRDKSARLGNPHTGFYYKSQRLDRHQKGKNVRISGAPDVRSNAEKNLAHHTDDWNQTVALLYDYGCPERHVREIADQKRGRANSYSRYYDGAVGFVIGHVCLRLCRSAEHAIEQSNWVDRAMDWDDCQMDRDTVESCIEMTFDKFGGDADV